MSLPYKKIPNAQTQDIDAALLGVVRRLREETGEDAFRFVLVALRYRERTGVPLKEAVTRALGLPWGTPGVAAWYIQQGVPGLRCEQRGNELYVCWAEGTAEDRLQTGLKTVGVAAGVAVAASALPFALPLAAVGAALYGVKKFLSSETPREANGRAPGAQTIPEAPLKVPQDNRLEQFAYIDYPSVLATVMQLAEPEAWGPQAWVLKYRLRGLFSWLANRWLGATPETRGRYLQIGRELAIMPLGLFDQGGGEMCLCFTPNRRGVPPWFTNAGCVAAPNMPAVRANAWVLRAAQRPEWPDMQAGAEPVACARAEFAPGEVAALVIAHLSALDEETLPHLCGAEPAVAEACRKALAARRMRQATTVGGQAAPDAIQGEAEAFRELSKAVNQSNAARLAIQRQAEQAIALLRVQLKRQPSLPVASYNQRADSPGAMRCMGRLLPLALNPERPGEASLALVVGHSGQGDAPAVQTCLSLGQAYAAARVVGAVDSSWLPASVLDLAIECPR